MRSPTARQLLVLDIFLENEKAGIRTRTSQVYRRLGLTHGDVESSVAALTRKGYLWLDVSQTKPTTRPTTKPRPAEMDDAVLMFELLTYISASGGWRAASQRLRVHNRSLREMIAQKRPITERVATIVSAERRTGGSAT